MIDILKVILLIITIPFVFGAFAWALMTFIRYFVWVLDLFFKNYH